MYELMVKTEFSAAHKIENYKGDCSRVHGHNYKLQIFIRGEKLNNTGMLVDFSEIKKELSQIIKKLDHQLLNQVLPFNPSSENLAKYFFENLAKRFQEKIEIHKTTIWENDNCSASFFKK